AGHGTPDGRGLCRGPRSCAGGRAAIPKLAPFAFLRCRRGSSPLARGSIAGRAEFAGGAPIGPGARICEIPSEIVEELVVLGHAGEVPIRLPLIARLVIVLF